MASAYVPTCNSYRYETYIQIGPQAAVSTVKIAVNTIIVLLQNNLLILSSIKSMLLLKFSYKRQEVCENVNFRLVASKNLYNQQLLLSRFKKIVSFTFCSNIYVPAFLLNW